MAIGTINTETVIHDAQTSVYSSGKNPMLAQFNIFSLIPSSEPYRLRILPPNYDEEKFGCPYNNFAVSVPQHYGVGKNKKEYVWCPEKISPKSKVKCPLCAEFANNPDTASERSKLKVYYYINAIILSKHKTSKGADIPIKKANGKYMVYTIKIPKKAVFEVIANYYKNKNRAVIDPVDLVNGCAIDITVGEQTIGANKKVPSYQVHIAEASRGNVGKVIDIDDIKDLRLLTEFIPTTAAMREAIDGMPIEEALSIAGKVSTITGEQIGGSIKINTPHANEESSDDNLGSDIQPEGDLDSGAETVNQNDLDPDEIPQ